MKPKVYSDSVIEGVWKAKDAIAAACDYNPEKLAEMLKDSALSRGLKTVDYHVAGRCRLVRRRWHALRKNRRQSRLDFQTFDQ